jgi:DNA-binding transcriptional regulator YiaG
MKDNHSMTPDQLRQAREGLGWTQPVAARLLGVSLRQYKYFEAGESSAGTSADVPPTIALAMMSFGFAHGTLSPEQLRAEVATAIRRGGGT